MPNNTRDLSLASHYFCRVIHFAFSKVFLGVRSLVSVFPELRLYPATPDSQPINIRLPHLLTYFYVNSVAIIVCACWALNTHQETCLGSKHVSRNWHLSNRNMTLGYEQCPTSTSRRKRSYYSGQIISFLSHFTKYNRKKVKDCEIKMKI